MPKPKITKLGDPSNPYTQKRVPTGREQDKPKPVKAVAVVARKPATGAPAKKGIIPALNDKYGGGARKRAIDAAIEGATGSKSRAKP